MDHSEMVHYLLPDGRVVMLMSGIPGWMFGLAIGAVVLLSFVVVEGRGLSAPSGWRFNLSGGRAVHRLLRKPWFQLAFQVPFAAMFLFTLYAGLFGSYTTNIAPVLVWTIWWAALIFAVAVFGNAWCFVCPWDAIARPFHRFSMGRALPGWMNNLWPAILLFVVLTWAELGWGVTNDPRKTALLGVVMVAGAVAYALLFRGRPFCETTCLVGRVSGMYSLFSPVEIRPRDIRVCKVCKTRDCKDACPMDLDLGELQENQYCTQCTDCFTACPSLAPAVNVRPPAADLAIERVGRMDEAWLALVLLALTAFHGLSMTPVWQTYEPGETDIVWTLQGWFGVGETAAFTVGMAMVMAVPIAAYALTTAAARALVRDTAVSFRDLFVAYAYSVLPVALFYHLAHNAMHLFMEGQDIVPVLSDPMGRGWDLFGTAGMHLDALVGQGPTWVVQVLLVVTGHLFGVVVSHRISRKLFPEKRHAVLSLLPMLVMMVLLSVGGLWLMHLDMNMRMGRM